MMTFLKKTFLGFGVLTCVYGYGAVDKNVAKECQVPQHSTATNKNQKATSSPSSGNSHYKAFTGKILASNVRMRLQGDVDSPIIKELIKDEFVVVMNEKNDFYAIEAPNHVKAFVFRSFILDNLVEGNRVNVRLAPELNSPVICYLHTGDRVNGSISNKNHKWLEIGVPKNVRFYVAKEYIEKIGGPETKALKDKKRENLVQLMDSAELLSQSEMMKSYEEIDFERISENFNTIINDYSDFSMYTDKAKHLLMELQESYLQKKLTFLESRASKMSRSIAAAGDPLIRVENDVSALTPKDRIKIWERVEESHFLSWATKHHQKTMDDYYEDQKMVATRISGIVESYNEIVKNKPGNYLIRDRDMPKAYLYSTFIDLHKYVGKYVTLSVSSRPNNNFAFPAFFVLEIIE